MTKIHQESETFIPICAEFLECSQNYLIDFMSCLFYFISDCGSSLKRRRMQIRTQSAWNTDMIRPEGHFVYILRQPKFSHLYNFLTKHYMPHRRSSVNEIAKNLLMEHLFAACLS